MNDRQHHGLSRRCVFHTITAGGTTAFGFAGRANSDSVSRWDMSQLFGELHLFRDQALPLLLRRQSVDDATDLEIFLPPDVQQLRCFSAAMESMTRSLEAHRTTGIAGLWDTTEPHRRLGSWSRGTLFRCPQLEEVVRQASRRTQRCSSLTRLSIRPHLRSQPTPLQAHHAHENLFKAASAIH